MSLTDRVTRRVAIDIDLGALQGNLARLRGHCPDARVFCVLKSDAYGHGAVACAKALQDADGFAVVHIDEAVQLREAGIRQPVLVLQGVVNTDELDTLVRYDCAMVVHDHSQCTLLERSERRQAVTVWMKVDSGMGRLGFHCDDAVAIAQRLRSLTGVRLHGLISHLACADSPANPFTEKQATRFRATAAQLPELTVSLVNSAGALAWPHYAFDWIRPGIALYGSNPLDVESPVPLQPVMRVTAPLIASKTVRRGDGIGYAQSFTAPEDMSVGYVAVGYGDGLPRGLSGAQVQIAGQPAAVLGRVSMDSIAVDLRHLDVVPGAEVLLWGAGAPVEKLATAAGTIGYELMCSIRGRRRYIGA